MAENPDDIVGHKTFETGEIDPETGFPKRRYEPLTRAEADELWKAVEAAKADRIARMPDEKSALRALHDSYTRLKELGWSDAIYCPKDGSHFKVIEIGSTGIHDCNYQGEWPNGHWLVYGDGDVYPSRPVLYRLYPDDQRKHDQQLAEGARRFREKMERGDFSPPSGSGGG